MTDSETKERYKIHERYFGMICYFFVYDTQKPFPECICGMYTIYSNAINACEKLNKKDQKAMSKVTYKLVETKSFYHIKRVCGGKETSLHRYDKRIITKESAQRITDIRNREAEENED